MSKSTHNVAIELRVVRRYNRRDGEGIVRSYFGFGVAPDGVEGDVNGRAGFSFVAGDAVAHDRHGSPVTAPNTFHFSNVIVQRALDQDDVPRVTGQRQTPVYDIMMTGDTVVEQRGLRFDPVAVEDHTRRASIANDEPAAE